MNTYTFDKKDFALWNKVFTKQKNNLRTWAQDSQNINQVLDKMLSNVLFDWFSPSIGFNALQDKRYQTLFDYFHEKELNLYSFLEPYLTKPAFITAPGYLLFAHLFATQVGTKVPYLEEHRLTDILHSIQNSSWHIEGTQHYVAFTLVKNSETTKDYVQLAFQQIENGLSATNATSLPLHWQQEIIDYIGTVPQEWRPVNWQSYCADILDTQFYTESTHIAFACNFNTKKIMARYNPNNESFYEYQKTLHSLYLALTKSKESIPFLEDVTLIHSSINYMDPVNNRIILTDKHETMNFHFVVPDQISKEKISTFFTAVAPTLFEEVSNDNTIEAEINIDFVNSALFNYQLNHTLTKKTGNTLVKKKI